jgi:hypothetical protein
MATFLTNLVAELESVNLSHASNREPVGVGAAWGGRWRRHDLARIVVHRLFVDRIKDDVLGQTMRSFF